MVVVHCSKKQIPDYIKFCKALYQSDANYRDSLTGILKSVLYGKSVFCNHADIQPLMIVEGEKILAVCTLIVSHRMKDTLQISFFEARENCPAAINVLVSHARKVSLEKGASKIVIGLNGHVNYGLGMLADHFEEASCFGNSYNPRYYIDYFQKLGAKEYTLISYLTDMKRYNLEKEAKLLARINKNFTFREADFNKLDREIKIYTDLNNRCFNGHPFYYERAVEEDEELFSQFKLFISGKNLLIAEFEGIPIGFMLWYPDFNQLIPQGKEIGFQTFIKNKLFGHRINKFKIAEIGVVPEFQGTGAILGLFDRCMQLTKGKYDWCEAGWILDSNQQSKGFGIRWSDMEYKHYKVFEIEIRGECYGSHKA